jgi:hypothetical protein
MPGMSMSVGERDKKMSDIASIAAEEFADKYDPARSGREREIKMVPQQYLEHTIPYLTVRALQRQEIALDRHEKALKSLEADSRWIKYLTFVLAGLTIALVFYAFRLDTVIRSLQETPPTATSSPTANPVTH